MQDWQNQGFYDGLIGSHMIHAFDNLRKFRKF